MYNINDLIVLRTQILPIFNDITGTLDEKIDHLFSRFSHINKELLYGLMNPNFDDIKNRFIHKSNVIDIIIDYGHCIGNNYENGVPIDPISLDLIENDDVIILKNTGYSGTSMSSLFTNVVRDPMTNLPIDNTNYDRIERSLAVDNNDLRNVMSSSDYDVWTRDDDVSLNKEEREWTREDDVSLNEEEREWTREDDLVDVSKNLFG